MKHTWAFNFHYDNQENMSFLLALESHFSCGKVGMALWIWSSAFKIHVNNWSSSFPCQVRKLKL